MVWEPLGYCGLHGKSLLGTAVKCQEALEGSRSILPTMVPVSKMAWKEKGPQSMNTALGRPVAGEQPKEFLGPIQKNCGYLEP